MGSGEGERPVCLAFSFFCNVYNVCHYLFSLPLGASFMIVTLPIYILYYFNMVYA